VLGGWTLSGGLALDWGLSHFAPSTGAPGLAECAGTLEPGDGGLLALPYLYGERTPVWDLGARGAVIGISSDTSSAQLYRALLDGVALSVRDHAERLANVVPPPESWLATGGGTWNDPLAQAISDALGCTLEIVSGAGEGAAPAVMALALLGIEPLPQIRCRVEPNLARHRTYSALYKHYRSLYSQVSELTRAVGAVASIGEFS
jgi:sugar (pentulose or hexulose) kinase